MGYRFRCKAQEGHIMKRPQHLFQIDMNSLIGLKLGADESSWVGIEVKELLGDAVNYDKKSRSLVLEFRTIQDAIRAINILPFGVNYKIFLLDINS